MQRITVGRYKDDDTKTEYAGWLEGVRDDGTEWILWLDGDGNPTAFWPQRDTDGGVIGEPVSLTG